MAEGAHLREPITTKLPDARAILIMNLTHHISYYFYYFMQTEPNGDAIKLKNAF